MSVRNRILALRLLEKQNKYPEYAKKAGIQVKMVAKNTDKEKKETFYGNKNRRNSG